MESIGLSAQEKKRKIDFQDDDHGGHLGFPIGTILATFDLQVTPMLPTKFRVYFSSGDHFVQQSRTILVILVKGDKRNISVNHFEIRPLAKEEMFKGFFF